MRLTTEDTESTEEFTEKCFLSQMPQKKSKKRVMVGPTRDADRGGGNAWSGVSGAAMRCW